MSRHLPAILNKITDRQTLAKRVAAWRLTGKKIVFTNGCFDLLHFGHVSYLAKARDLGDILILGLNADSSVKKIKGPNRPLNPEYARATVLAALQCVDAVVLFDEDTPLNLISLLKPDVIVKGGDYTEETVVGAKEVRAYGGDVQIIGFEDGFSTTSIIEKMNHGKG